MGAACVVLTASALADTSLALLPIWYDRIPPPLGGGSDVAFECKSGAGSDHLSLVTDSSKRVSKRDPRSFSGMAARTGCSLALKPRCRNASFRSIKAVKSPLTAAFVDAAKDMRVW